MTGILVVAEDVTERRRMLEQFHQAERLGAMARLAGGVAHDFNNLLTVILGSSEVLLRRADADAEWRDDVAAIQRAGRAGRRPHQSAAGHRSPAAGPVRGGRPRRRHGVHAAHDPAGCSARTSSWSSSPAPRPGRILADPAELERALLNMVINARDAMPDGGRIEFSTKVMGADAPRVVAGGGPHGVGQRGRDGAGDGRALLRALLHHQGPGPGDGPGSGRRARHGHPGRRPHHGGITLGRGPPSPCGSRRRGRRRGRTGGGGSTAGSTGATR